MSPSLVNASQGMKRYFNVGTKKNDEVNCKTNWRALQPTINDFSVKFPLHETSVPSLHIT